VTEGELKQRWRKMLEETKVKGTGMGGVMGWNRRARVNYVYC